MTDPLSSASSEIECANVEIELCYNGWRKLIDLVEEQFLKETMFRVADDMHSAVAEAKEAHQKLHQFIHEAKQKTGAVKTGDAQMEALSHLILEIEQHITEAEMFCAASAKLFDYLPDDCISRDVLIRMSEDMGDATREIRRIFNEMHDTAHPDHQARTAETKRVVDAAVDY